MMFTDVAVAVSGPDKGTAYDAVAWGFWKSADGQIYSSGRLEEVPTYSPTIQDAINAWNGRAGVTPVAITKWQ